MSVFIAVIQDLWQFAIGDTSKSTLASETVKKYETHLAQAAQRLPAVTKTQPVPDVVVVPKAITSSVVWISAHTPLYMQPSYEIDTQITNLPLGSRVSVLEQRGGWVKVSYQDLEGWVALRAVTENPEAVQVNFSPGDSVSTDNQNALLVRTLINDEFSAGGLSEFLLDIEYVLYRLEQAGRHIPWPSDRPRVAGRWQQLLKGKRGIYMTVTPKTDSVIEFENPLGTKNIAYVEAVYPDERIRLVGIYGADKTTYQSEEMSAAEWREWRPVFISVS